jgi:hypothetical protein
MERYALGDRLYQGAGPNPTGYLMLSNFLPFLADWFTVGCALLVRSLHLDASKIKNVCLYLDLA